MPPATTAAAYPEENALSVVSADRLPLQLLADWAATTPDTIYLSQPLPDSTVRAFT